MGAREERFFPSLTVKVTALSCFFLLITSCLNPCLLFLVLACNACLRLQSWRGRLPASTEPAMASESLAAGAGGRGCSKSTWRKGRLSETAAAVAAVIQMTPLDAPQLVPCMCALARSGIHFSPSLFWPKASSSFFAFPVAAAAFLDFLRLFPHSCSRGRGK